MTPDEKRIVERLNILHVWPQSVASHHADVLTPRQIKELYEVGNVATDAVIYIKKLEQALRKIDRMNDHPKWFRTELNSIIEAAIERGDHRKD